jgi:mono/diheme cytochrome c family protein
MFRHNSKPQWVTNASRRLVCGMVLGVACGLAGCGPGPQAEFQYRDSTKRLILDAQRAMKKTLKEGFGTPHELVAWDRFPITYGGVKGSVAAPAEGATLEAQTLTVAFEGDAAKISTGAPLLWLTGARAGEKTAADTVAAYDAKTNQLKWSGSAEPVPAPGDTFVIGFGQTLQQGRAVYMKNCMHCHGVTGDGAGPTAQYLYPRPRDYRLGVFKFTSTLAAEKVSRDDLHRVVKYGIPGTYMPSFLLLGDAETKAVVEYVRWLSVRGEFEKRTDDDLADFSQDAVDNTVKRAAANFEEAKKAGEKPEKLTAAQARKEAAEAFAKFEKEDFETAVEDTATFLAEVWTRADDVANVIVPSVPRVTDDAASRERGRLLYMSDKTKCYTCHGMLGKGDGAATEDFWKKPGSEEFYPERGLFDAWGGKLQPRNLTLGQYRGGRRPIDVFRRIYAGIKGTPMPGFGKTALKDGEIWDIVNYAMSIQYQSQQPTKANAGGHLAVTEASTAK